MKLKFNEKKVVKAIKSVFPKAKIISYKKFERGLAHQTYKVKIKNPNQYLVVRIYKLKNKKKVDANIQAIKFLRKKKFPTPQIYSNTLFKNQGIIIMEYLNGKEAEKVLLNSPNNIKVKILINSGKLLKRLHSMPIPHFWKHFKHDVKNNKEWVKWTRQRIKKYLQFAKENLKKEYFQFLEKEFTEFSKQLNKNFKLVPMHWDFHLGNILVNKKGDLVGIVDFDNTLRGDALAELGQIHHSLRFSTKNYKFLKYFLLGYNKKLSKKDENFIKWYSLMHNVAVTRSVWKKKKRLGWLIKENLKIIKEMMYNKKLI
ncbi:MAG: aminoglycoside phosphotransferase family protein [Nanoarchaeota archaeon]|nr:aminoglycoside phosphotransferase family protein [Nanoarchaeota archaeon]